MAMDQKYSLSPASKGGVVRAIPVDKAQGMVLAVALGDALGAPFELRRSLKLAMYSGKLEHRAPTFAMFTSPKKLAVGQVTDDTEMTIVLLRHLAQNRMRVKYEGLVMGYMAWCNSNTPCLGRNTRGLLKGVKTFKGYKNRRTKLFAKNPNNQSNGALMRCSPLALIRDERERKRMIKIDCSITNPNQVCIDVNTVHVHMIHLALTRPDLSKKQIFANALKTFCGIDKPEFGRRHTPKMNEESPEPSAEAEPSGGDVGPHAGQKRKAPQDELRATSDPECSDSDDEGHRKRRKLANNGRATSDPDLGKRPTNKELESGVELSSRQSVPKAIKYHRQEVDEPGKISRQVRQILVDVDRRKARDVTGKSKGWCLHAFYLSLYSFLYKDSFKDAIDWVIREGGDTDTNAAIAGALLGAFHGRVKMEEDSTTRENLRILLACTPTSENSDVPREPKYHATQLLAALHHYFKFANRASLPQFSSGYQR